MQPGCKYWYKKPNATGLQSVRYNFAPRKQKKKKTMKKRIVFIAVITMAAFAGFTFISRETHAEAHEAEHEEEIDFDNIPLTQRQVEAVDLKMGETTQREMDATIQATGALVLRAQDQGDVASLMGGVVKNIYVKEGEAVSRGQVVATVENTDVVSLQREYFSAAKECELAKAELDRQKTLSQNGAGIKKNLQQTQKDYQVAHANLVGISKQLTQMGISTAAVTQGKFTTTFPLRAPISGIVSQITASLGSYADMQSPLMKIRNNAAVECDLNIFEKDIAKIKTGNRVWLSLTNQPGVKLSGVVSGMNQYFNDGSKSVAVHVKINPTKGIHLFDGMYVSGQIATGTLQCQAVPSQSIVSTDGKQYIFALNGKPSKGKYSFSRHEVTTGVSDGKFTEVQLCKHIKQGTKIVTGNAFYLASLTGDHGEED